MRFLIIDDSATMRKVLINSLQRIGYNDVVEAEDGVDALGKFDESIEFVITDWNMPNMSGVELIRALRANAHGKEIPILMVTTRNKRQDILEAASEGVDNYVVKPFTPPILKEKIDWILARKR